MGDYNTAINPLGSIPDINIIIETIKYFNNTRDITKTEKEFVEGNAFGFDITSSRKRFFSVIKKIFLVEPDKLDNKFFIKTVSQNRLNLYLKRGILYLEVCRKNRLFFDITLKLVYKKYKENRKLITSNEVFDFLISIEKDTKISKWSESTIKTIATKYISFMKRMGYFEKEKKYKSSFSFPRPDEKIISYIVYLLKIAGKSDNEILQSHLFTTFMLTEEEKIELLKKGSLAGYYNFNLSGNKNAIFELQYEGEEIIDELFR